MSGFHICSVCLWITLASFPTAKTIVTTGVCLHGLGRQVVPSAHMKALMQHCQAAGFSKEVTVEYNYSIIVNKWSLEKCS